MFINKIKKAVNNPRLFLTHLCQYWPFRYISDENYLKLFFRAHQGYKLDLENPKTFNEKLQWLKLYERRPEYALMTDKYLVREYIKEKIGEEVLIPLLGVWENAKDIDFNKLPNSFVLKCNHDSGSVVVCSDKNKLDIAETIKKLNKALKIQYYWKSREWNYHDIKPRIIAEKYMTDESGVGLTDYKFFCFNGVPSFIQLDRGRFVNHIRNFYTSNWEYIPVEYGCKNDPSLEIEKPIQFEKMMKYAKKLSKGIPHVRVDFYISGGKIYFGELTFHHGGGAMNVVPFSYDEEWGKLLELPNKFI